MLQPFMPQPKILSATGNDALQVVEPRGWARNQFMLI